MIRRQRPILILITPLVGVMFFMAVTSSGDLAVRGDARAMLTGTAQVTRAPQPTPIAAPTAEPRSFGEHRVFVLDVLNGRVLTELHAIDADVPEDVATVSLRYTPAIALSSHIEHMYVLDTYLARGTRGDAKSVLSVLDVNTMEILADDVHVPDRLMYKVYPVGDRWFFVSPDGSYLFVGKYGEPNVQNLRMAVLDARTYEQLAEYPYPVCDDNRVQIMQDGRLLCVRGMNLLSIDPMTGQEMPLLNIRARSTQFTMMGRGTEAATQGTATGERWYHFDRQGRVTVVDVGVDPPRVLSEGAGLAMPAQHGLGGETLAAISDDGRLYVGLVSTSSDLSGRGLADVIRVYDTATWEVLGEIKPREPNGYLAVSNDGTQLYTTSLHARTFAVYDTVAFEEIGRIENFGVTPAQILVPKDIDE